jgi:hypothetical protein
MNYACDAEVSDYWFKTFTLGVILSDSKEALLAKNVGIGVKRFFTIAQNDGEFGIT